MPRFLVFAVSALFAAFLLEGCKERNTDNADVKELQPYQVNYANDIRRIHPQLKLVVDDLAASKGAYITKNENAGHVWGWDMVRYYKIPDQGKFVYATLKTNVPNLENRNAGKEFNVALENVDGNQVRILTAGLRTLHNQGVDVRLLALIIVGSEFVPNDGMPGTVTNHHAFLKSAQEVVDFKKKWDQLMTTVHAN